MKNKFFTALFAMVFVGGTYAQEVVIPKNQLPQSVQKNIVKYFGKKAIGSVVKDKEGFKVVYDIYFEDQTQAEFSSNGDLTEVKNYHKIPEVVVPQRVLAYVKKNYPQVAITHWEKERNKQKVELNNGLELEFDLKGNFLRLDD